jgi:hypothetical protein
MWQLQVHVFKTFLTVFFNGCTFVDSQPIGTNTIPLAVTTLSCTPDDGC